MQLSIKSVGGARIEGDLSGLTELRDLLAEVIDQGHGLGSDGTLPAVTLLDAKGKPVLPARKVKPSPEPMAPGPGIPVRDLIAEPRPGMQPKPASMVGYVTDSVVPDEAMPERVRKALKPA